MLQLALSLLSSLQIGAKVKHSFERTLRQATAILIASLILIAACAFGLLAAYHALSTSYGFSQAEAAGIIASALVLLGGLVLAYALFAQRERRKPAPAPVGLTDTVAGIDREVASAMQQVGPISLLAIAFLAGILVSRRR
jgi:hypothetical protein